MGSSQSYDKIEDEIDNTEYEEAKKKDDELFKKINEIDDEIVEKIKSYINVFIDIECKEYENKKKNGHIILVVIAYNVVIPIGKYKIHIKRFEKTDDAEEYVKNLHEMLSIIENKIIPKFNVVLE